MCNYNRERLNLDFASGVVLIEREHAIIARSREFCSYERAVKHIGVEKMSRQGAGVLKFITIRLQSPLIKLHM